MSKFGELFGQLVKTAAVAGEVALDVGVKGKRKDGTGCTPCAANARAEAMHQKNMKMMGIGSKKAKAKKAAAPKH